MVHRQVGLPDGDGVDLLRHVRARGSTTILVLSVLGDVEDRLRGLECGADDYLVKPFEFVELLARARALLRRGRLPLPSVLRCGDIELVDEQLRAAADAASSSTTLADLAARAARSGSLSSLTAAEAQLSADRTRLRQIELEQARAELVAGLVATVGP